MRGERGRHIGPNATRPINPPLCARTCHRISHERFTSVSTDGNPIIITAPLYRSSVCYSHSKRNISMVSICPRAPSPSHSATPLTVGLVALHGKTMSYLWSTLNMVQQTVRLCQLCGTLTIWVCPFAALSLVYSDTTQLNSTRRRVELS